MKTFYDLLKVSEDASYEEIVNAYKTQKSKYEAYLLIPMKKEQTEEILKKIDVAYKVLTNENNREAYDKDLANMRNNELMSNLQKNTSEYNKEVEEREAKQKQEELEKEEIRQQQEVEELQKRRVEAVKNAIEQQVKAQKQQIDAENKTRKMLQNAIEKEYKKQVFNSKFKILVKKILVIVVVLVVIFLILQLPFVKDFYETRINFLKSFFE